MNVTVELTTFWRNILIENSEITITYDQKGFINLFQFLEKEIELR